MGNSSSISAAAVEEAKIQTHMTDEEVQRLKRRFQKFVGKRNTEATLEEFSSLPELSNNPYVPRLFALMDLDRNGKINFLEFCLGMGMYRSLRKTRDGKIQLLMKLHDRDNDEKLSISELTDLLSVTAGKSLSAELLGQVASSLLSAYDADKDAKEDETSFSLAAAAGAAAVAAAGGKLLLLFRRARSGTSVNLDWNLGFRAAATAPTPGATVTAGVASAAVALVAVTTVTLAGVAVGMLPSIRRILQSSTKTGSVDWFYTSSVSRSLSNELPSRIVLLSLEELVFLCTHVKCMVYVNHHTNVHTAATREGVSERKAEQQSMEGREEPAEAAPSRQLVTQQTISEGDASRRDPSGEDCNWSGSARRDSSRRDGHSLEPTAAWEEVKEQELLQYGEVWRRGFGAMAAVYGQLRGRNWVVRPGLQFGSHFTAYQHHPALVHSNFMVLVNGPGLNNPIPTWNDLHATVRLASTVAKKILIAYVEEEEEKEADEQSHAGLQADMLGTGITEPCIGEGWEQGERGQGRQRCNNSSNGGGDGGGQSGRGGCGDGGGGDVGCSGGGSSTSAVSQSSGGRGNVRKQEVIMLRVTKWNPERNREKRTHR
ncbi:unnamed protein product [Closterium sp. NIES-53]